MGLSIREKADTVGTLRFASVFAMEALARWIPTTPELEAKVCFGRHVWEFAQHADALGRRTAELRAALHHSAPPTSAYGALLDQLAGTVPTRERISVFYDGLLADLERRYRTFLGTTDHLLDEPSVRIMERILQDFARMRGEALALVRERPELADATTGPAWAGAAGRVAEWVVSRPASPPKVVA